MNFILSEYILSAMDFAEYEKLDDGSYAGRISLCKGVIAFGKTLSDTNKELQSTLEDWVLTGLKLRHFLPVINNIDLNINVIDNQYESV